MTEYASVEFGYEGRTDPVSQYVGGSKVGNDARLKSIKTFLGTTLVREYTISYDYGPDTNRSRITSLRECDGSGECLLPTVFNYQDGTNAINVGTTWGSYTGSLANSSTFFNSGFFDVNGDGQQDYVFRNSGSTTLNVMLSTGSSLSAPTPWGSYTGSTTSSNTFFNSGIFDVNADGRADFVYRTSGNVLNVMLSTGTSFAPPAPWGTYSGSTTSSNNFFNSGFFDVNADSRADFVYRTSGKVLNVMLSNGTSLDPPVAWGTYTGTEANEADFFTSGLSDVNGDGRQDFVYRNSGSQAINVMLSTGTSFNAPVSWGSYVGPESQGGLFNAEFRDVNNDGKDDFIYRRYQTIDLYVMLSNGISFEAETLWATYTHSGGGFPELHALLNYGFYDVNGDGLLDHIYNEVVYIYNTNNIVSTKLFALLGTGTSFTTGVLLSTGPFDLPAQMLFIYDAEHKPYNQRMFDLNGDGRHDHAHWEPSTSAITITKDNDPYPDLLTSVSNGLGVVTNFTYKPVTDDLVYTKGSGAAFPLLDYQSPVYVVSQTNSDDGVGGSYVMDYSYADGVLDLEGRGFLGFGTVTSLDNETNVQTVTTYRQDYPYIGVADYSESTINNQIISSVDNVLSEISAGSVHFPYISSSTEKAFELPGGLANEYKTITTGYTYDSFGNPGTINVTTTSGGVSFSKNTVNTYDPADTVIWSIDRVSETTVTHTSATDQKIKKSGFTYYTSGLLKEEIIEPDQPATSPLRLTTLYEYDSFGNKTKATVTGLKGYLPASGTESRITQTPYDTQGRFPLSTTNAEGHQEFYGYDARFGTRTSLIGPNSLPTTWVYDSFGRKILETRADGTETTWDYSFCATADCPNGGFIETVSASGSAPVITYNDDLQRPFRTVSTGLTGQTIYQDTAYDSQGNVASQSRNYFTASQTPQNSTFIYDALNRPKQEDHPDGGRILYDYQGLTRTITRTTVNGDYTQIEARVHNVLEKLTRVTDAMNGTLDYIYDAADHLIKTTDSAANDTLASFDIRGRKLTMDDPDMGHWEYQYNAFGELVWQKDAKNQIVTTGYDMLGRVTSRVEPEGISTWTYDTATKGVGKLAQVVYTASGHTRSYTYDSLGRLATDTSNIDAETLSMAYTYDGFSRRETVTYPTGFIVRNVYSSTGHLIEVKDAANDSSFWLATEDDADGHITMETLGNGLETLRGYSNTNGTLQFISTGAGMSSNVQDLAYQFDQLGNLKQRQDVNLSLTEDFVYDNQNRLKDVTLNGIGPITYGYDALGNIKQKPGVGNNYIYGEGPAGPHAVTTIKDNGVTVTTYTYDANGNMQSDSDGRIISWTSFNKSSQIIKGATTLTFAYDADYNRIKQQVNGTETTYYLSPRIDAGNHFEKEIDGATVENKHYIYAAGQAIAIYTTKSDSTKQTRYLHKDHLGSTDVLTDETGAIVERQSFDAFGGRRSATDWNTPISVMTPFEAHHGFTGHEQLDEVGIIHMNGRLYDPRMGRFLSPDIQVQYPDNTQSFNRYSYVHNNPLSYTDPSGYGFLSDIWKGVKSFFKKYGRQIAAIAVLFIPGLNGIAGALFKGFLSGLIISGGDLKTGIIGAFTAAAFYGIGQSFGAPGTLTTPDKFAKVLAHGAVGGASSTLQGGKFTAGFLAAGTSQAFAVSGGYEALGVTDNPSSPSEWIGNAAASAVVGGTGAVIGGGKFANGAVTGAFSRLFNDLSHRSQNLAISNEERQFAADGDTRAFWESRLAIGDPLAPTALGIINNTGLGWVANRLASFGIAVSGSSATLNELSVDLMRAHVSAVDFDFANSIGTVPGSLSVGQIRDYHYGVFDNLGIPRWVYGGTPGPLGVGYTDWLYCGGCDADGIGIR